MDQSAMGSVRDVGGTIGEVSTIMNSSNHLMCQLLRTTHLRSSRRWAAARTCSRRAFGTDNDMNDKTVYFHISPR